jgi:hypothetical protein
MSCLHPPLLARSALRRVDLLQIARCAGSGGGGTCRAGVFCRSRMDHAERAPLENGSLPWCGERVEAVHTAAPRITAHRGAVSGREFRTLKSGSWRFADEHSLRGRLLALHRRATRAPSTGADENSQEWPTQARNATWYVAEGRDASPADELARWQKLQHDSVARTWRSVDGCTTGRPRACLPQLAAASCTATTTCAACPVAATPFTSICTIGCRVPKEAPT